MREGRRAIDWGNNPFIWQAPSRRALTSTRGGGRANCGSKPIAAAELGPDKIAVFAKSLAQREDLNLQVLLRDNDAWPHAAHELFFGDQRSVGLQQGQEEIEARVPNSIGTPLATNCRRRSRMRKRPNSSIASAAAGLGLDRLPPCGGGFSG